MAPRGTKTTITLGSVEAPVQLYKTIGDPPDSNEKLIVRAAPSGGEIVYRSQLEEGERADPLLAAVTSPLRAAVSPASLVVREDPLVDSITGEPVTAEDVRRGIRTEDGEFIDLTEHLAQIEENSILESMDVIAFIRRERVPRERITGSYWMAPQDVYGRRVLNLVREAMRVTQHVALVRWTKRTKQSLGLLVPHRSGALLLLEVAFFSRVREAPAKAIFPSGACQPDELTAAVKLIRAMEDAPVAIDEMEDDAEVARAQLIEQALAGEIVGPSEPEKVLDPEMLDRFIESIERAGA
jgi:non-homologous end joining protein Ku